MASPEDKAEEEDVGPVVIELIQPSFDRLRPLYKPIDAVPRPLGFGILERTRVIEMNFEALPIHVRNDAPQNHVPHGVLPHLAGGGNGGAVGADWV